jgi:hypothetical protein
VPRNAMPERREQKRALITPIHRLQWLWEPLTSDPSFVLRSMFGVKAAYLGGKLMLCFCARQEPWRGLLVCTDRQRQAALREEFSQLAPHSVLPKWLYLPESDESFEATGARLVLLARKHDPRLGIEPTVTRKKARRPRRRG